MIRRTLAQIRARAREELAHNPSIMVYEILEDGYELRRPANPFAGMRSSFERLTASFDRAADSLASFRDAFGGLGEVAK